MRIRSVRIQGHPGLGDIEAVFCKEDEPAPKAVVLAGENGCGKTIILNSIHQALNEDNHSLADGIVTLVVETGSLATEFLRQELGQKSDGKLRIQMRRLASGIYEREYFIQQGKSWHPIAEYLLNSIKARESQVLATSLFSEAALNFDPRPITHATGDSAETSLLQKRSGGMGRDLATETAQLFVNIRMADNEDLRRHIDTHGCKPLTWPTGTREAVFTEAIGRIFPGKRLLGGAPGRAHEVIFEERGKQSTLSQLSTGEKQIVFRGGFLLARQAALSGALVLIDEPELSLHPNWQAGIFAFYEQIVFGDAEAVTSIGAAQQLILATHSPFVVHGSPGAKHVVLARESDNCIKATAHPTYPGVTGEVAIAAFDIGNFLADASGLRTPVLLVEGPSDQALLLEAWRRLRRSTPIPFDVQPAYGATGIGTLLRQPAYLAAFAKKRSAVCGLLDFDQRGYTEWNRLQKDWTEVETATTCGLAKRHNEGFAWAMLLPVPTYRNKYTNSKRPDLAVLEIEHLFTDERIQKFAEDVEAHGGSFLSVPDGKKKAFAQAAVKFEDADFASFEPIFRQLDAIRAEIAST